MAKTKKLCSWDCEPGSGATLFTTGNVNEVLPGVIRPLYADLCKDWDYRWVKRVVETLGVADQVVVEPPPFFTLLGFFGGRWAVNVSLSLELSASYEVGEGSAMLTQFFEGGDAVTSGAAGDKARAAAANAIINDRWANIGKIERSNDRLSRASASAGRKRRLHALSNQQLVDLVEANTELMGELFEGHFYVTVGGGDFAARLTGLLAQHCFKGNVERVPSDWVTTLTSALRGVESAKPGEGIWDLSRLIAGRKSLANMFPALTTEQILTRLAAPPDGDWEALSVAYRAFIREYGWRGYRESDPSTPTWDEAPGFVIGAIKSDLAAPASANPYAREEAAAKARERLEARVFAKVPANARKAFERHLRLTQALAKSREGMKATWARASRNYRAPLLELGRRSSAEGILGAAEDVWFLRWSEVQAAGTGTLEATAAKKAVESRRAEYARLQDFNLPDGVFTWPADLVAIETAATSKLTEFKGLAVSAGVATGKARVILDASDDSHIEPGEILVAPVTDAPWTPLFIPAAAVVVEMGGVLSHAATVAREFGIPAVSGIKDATKILRTGQLLRVDGNTGTVTILSR